MRTEGLEPSRSLRTTRPSTWRVYQFRHVRIEIDVRSAPSTPARSAHPYRRADSNRQLARVERTTSARLGHCGGVPNLGFEPRLPAV